MAERLTAMFVALVFVALAACAPPALLVATGPSGSAGPLVWPEPPRRARIRLVNVVSRPEDLGIRPSFWKRVEAVLFGEEENWFIRPTGVAAMDKTLYIADPGAQALWILDPESERFNKIRKLGAEELISPVAVALGNHGRSFLADSYLAKVFICDADGKLVRAIKEPNLVRPTGLAYDPKRDRLYVADSGAHKVWIYTGDGKPVGLIGARGMADGQFNFPTHLAVDRMGNLYVTDALNFRLQIITPEGRFAGKIGRHGDASGDFAAPKGIGIDSAGQVYIVDALFDGVQIFDREGRYLLTFGKNGIGPGQFWLPGGLFLGADDRIYVADSYNQRIQVFEYLPGGTDG